MDASQHAPIPSDARSASSSEPVAPESSLNDSKPSASKTEKARRIGRIAGRWFAALSAFTLVAGLYITTFHLHLGGLYHLSLLGLAALPLMFGFGATWALLRLRGINKLAGLALVLLLCATFVGLPWCPIGMQFAALVSRPALNELVERVRAGETIDWPARAGLFVAVGIRTQGPIVALVIRDETNGDSALVHFPAGSRGDAEITGVEELAFYGPMYNLNWNVALGGGWRYQDED